MEKPTNDVEAWKWLLSCGLPFIVRSPDSGYRGTKQNRSEWFVEMFDHDPKEKVHLRGAGDDLAGAVVDLYESAVEAGYDERSEPFVPQAWER